MPPIAGRIVFDGQDITGWRPDRITRRGLVRTFQIARGLPAADGAARTCCSIGPEQPGERSLAALLRTPRRRASARRTLRERAAEIAGAAATRRPCSTSPAAALSGGQKKLLEIGRALMAEPKLILLDEPIAGVNPSWPRDRRAAARDRRRGLDPALIEHQMDMIARLCDHVVVMAEGRRLTEGSFADVAAEPRVQEAYMGRRACAS